MKVTEKQNIKQLEAFKKRQQEYWQSRAENKFLTGEKEALQLAKKLKTNYEKTYKEIETKLNLFYGKFASENGLTLEDAKKLLDKTELKTFKQNIKEILALGKKENFTDAQLKKFKILYAKTRVSRLDELQANIQYELDKLTTINKDNIQELLENTYSDGYYKTIFDVEQFRGFSDSFTGLNKQAIGKAITTNYLGSNFSSRLWANKNNLTTILEQEIPRGITLGYNPRKLANLVSKKLDTNYNNTVRLIRTEYNKVLNDATYDGYKACGVQQYQILATLDNRTSEICQEMDSTIVGLADKQIGVNYPPFHPNCRTTTIPYFEPDEFDDMNATVLNTKTGKQVPLNISYKEWKEGLQGKNELNYENKNPLVEATSDIEKWKNSLTRQEVEALSNYTWKEYGDTSVANFEDINNYLRNGEISKVGKTKIENAISNIDNAIDKYKLEKDLVLYRGIDTPTLIEQAIGEKKWTRNEDAISGYLKNKTIENKAFTSTSLSQKEASNFGLGNNSCILRINAPAGTKGAYIDTVSKISKEKEFLLARNINFKINRIKFDNRIERFIVYCDLI